MYNNFILNAYSIRTIKIKTFGRIYHTVKVSKDNIQSKSYLEKWKENQLTLIKWYKLYVVIMVEKFFVKKSNKFN